MPRRWAKRTRRLVWLCAALAVVLAALFGVYKYLTHPARLHAQALAVLRATCPADVTLERATYAPWTGLELRGLVLAGPARTGTGTPPEVRIDSARLDCPWSELLRGRVRPASVALSDVRLAIPSDLGGLTDADAATDADAGALLLHRLIEAGGANLPPIDATSVQLDFVRTQDGERRTVARWLGDVHGRPERTGYVVRLLAQDRSRTQTGSIEWSPGARAFLLSFAPQRIADLAAALPAAMREAVAGIGLDGSVHFDSIVLRAADDLTENRTATPLYVAAFDVGLSNLSGFVPVEEGDAVELQRAGARFLRFSQASVAVRFSHVEPTVAGTLTVRAAGRLREAPAEFDAAVLLPPATSLWRVLVAGGAGLGDLSLDDVRSAALRIDGLELPTLETAPAFVLSKRLPNVIAEVFDDYHPAGRINMRLEVLPSGSADDSGMTLRGADRVVGTFESLGGRCRYFNFPYDFEDIWGTLRYAQGRVLVEDMRGLHGAARVHAVGVIYNTNEWTGFEMNFRGEDVPLDGDLYAALPGAYRALWQQAAPLGLCDVRTTVRREDGSEEAGSRDLNILVDAQLRGGSVSLGDDRRLLGASGRLVVQDAVVQLRDLQGHCDDADLLVNGTVRLDAGQPRVDLHVTASNYRVQEVVRVPGGGQPSALHVDARADVSGHVFHRGDDAQPTEVYTCDLRGGTLYGDDPSLSLTITGGEATVCDGVITVRNFTCGNDRTRITASGSLPKDDHAAPLDLRLHATTDALETWLPLITPPAWAGLSTQVGLSGRGALTLEIAPGADAEPRARIDIEAQRVRPAAMPVELRDVACVLSVTRDGFRLESASGLHGTDGRIRASGTGHFAGAGSNARFELTAQRLAFDPELVAALPHAMRPLLEKLAPRGEFDAFLGEVKATGGETPRWSISGRMPIRNLTLHVGYDLYVEQGVLSGTCRVEPDDRIHFDGTFLVDRGQIGGRDIERWQGQLTYDPDLRRLVLANLNGQLCDGDALANIAVDPDSGAYELVIQLRSIDAARLMPPKDPESRRTGRVSGEVWLRGRQDDPANLRGGGNLQIIGTSFLHSPVLRPVFVDRSAAGGASRPSASDYVERAVVRFLRQGTDVALEHIDIRGRDLRLVGEGTWDMQRDTVDLTLYAAQPEHWPHVAVLTDLLVLAGQEIVKYRVVGPIASPQTSAEPLHRINDALRRLLLGSGQ